MRQGATDEAVNQAVRQWMSRPQLKRIPLCGSRLAMKTRTLRARREVWNAQHGGLYGRLLALFDLADPIGIVVRGRRNVYEFEVETVVPRLHSCFTVTDVQRVLYEEFTRWFSEPIAGRPTEYRDLAAKTWRLWRAT